MKKIYFELGVEEKEISLNFYREVNLTWVLRNMHPRVRFKEGFLLLEILKTPISLLALSS